MINVCNAECCSVPIFVCGGYALSGCKEALGILSAKLEDYGANQLYDESKWQSLMDRIFYLAENKLITRDCFYTHVRPYIGQQVADAIYGDNGVPFTISQNGSPESK